MCSSQKQIVDLEVWILQHRFQLLAPVSLFLCCYLLFAVFVLHFKWSNCDAKPLSSAEPHSVVVSD